MAISQIIADLMANLRHSRDVKRKNASMVPRKNILTTSSSDDTHKATASEFLRHYPALGDPRNFLQLITKYATADILLWANNGRKLPVLSSHNIQELRKRSTKLMGERTPGGKATLTKILDIVKSHNRLDDSKHKFTHIRPEVVCMNIDAWYGCISQSATSDPKLPLCFTHITAARPALTLLLGNDSTQRVSLILSELLHDPLFPYCNLQDIPDHVLLEWCATHSYPHLLDKLKVNNPCITATQDTIRIWVQNLIQAPVLWAPEVVVESIVVEDDTQSIDSRNSLFMDDDDMDDDEGPESVGEYFQRCGTCIDDDVARCGVDTGLRQPGQHCSRCKTLGEPCEDRSTRERHASLTPETFEEEYRKRQRCDGHLAGKIAEKKKACPLSSNRTFEVRAHLYPLLLDEFSGRHGSPASTSILCLPKKKPDEGKILALIGSISEPCDTAHLEKEQAALISASTSNKENIPVDVNAIQANEDDDMDDDDAENTVMNAIESMIKSSQVARGHVDEKMSD